MRHSILIIFLIIVFSGRYSFAENVEYYLTLLDNHPSIQRVLQEKEALDFQAEGALGLPDPVLSLGVENIPISDPSFDQYLPSSKTIGFSQNIPNPTKRSAQKSVYNQSAVVQQLLAEYSRSRLHTLFYQKLAEYSRIEEQLLIEGKKKKIIEELVQFYQGEVFAGEPAFQKTFAIELELSDVEKSINDLQSEKKVVEAKFIQLVGEIPELTDVENQEKVWSGITENLYPVILATQKTRIADEKIKVVDAAFNPDFGLAATYKNREDGENNSFDGDDWFSLQVRMTIPLWASSSQEPKLASARARKRSALFELEDVRSSWEMHMANISTKTQAAHNNIFILNKKKISLEQSIEALKTTYASGQTSLEPSLTAELKRLSLLSRIAQEEETYIRNLQEANAHIHRGK